MKTLFLFLFACSIFGHSNAQCIPTSKLSVEYATSYAVKFNWTPTDGAVSYALSWCPELIDSCDVYVPNTAASTYTVYGVPPATHTFYLYASCTSNLSGYILSDSVTFSTVTRPSKSRNKPQK